MSSPQQIIGHYRITTKLGQGGMGEVWRATDTKLNREVAIKVLPPAFASDPGRMARFKQEAQVLASLNHPGIATIHGVEENALVMELVEGATLAERIAQGKLPLEEALPIILQIAEALEYAHERGIVHRDLKPANIKITPEGRVKILDFGLAKAVSAESSAEAQAEAVTLTTPATLAGAILGTAAYMAPEQARGQNVDRRADVWAFGVVLYEMLTGERPFGGPTISDTLAAVLTAAPDLERAPASARRLLRVCLEKNPKRRLRDISDGLLLLETDAAPAPPRRPRWFPAAFAAVGVIAGAAAAWWLKPVPRSSPVVARFRIELPPGQSLLGIGSHLALSPDGSTLAYTSGGYTSVGQLYIRPLNSLSAAPILAARSVFSPEFSPDGQWIAYAFGGRTVEKVPATGGAPVYLCPTGGTIHGLSWRGHRIVFGADGVDADRIMTVADSGGVPRTVLTEPSSMLLTVAAILPDGRHVLYSLGSPSSSTSQVLVAGLDGSGRRVLLTGGADPVLLPGALIYMYNGTLYGVPFDARKLAVTGAPAPLIQGVQYTGERGQFVAADNGTLAYIPPTATEKVSLVWVDRQGHEQPLAALPQTYEYPAISPDGLEIAVCMRAGPTWVWNVQRASFRRLSFDAGASFYPIWTPDGNRIVYEAQATGVRSAAADGVGQPALVSKDASLLPQAITPDGRVLIVRVGNPPGSTLEQMPLAGGTPTPLFPGLQASQQDAAFSPDGRWLAYASDESGRNEVYVRPWPALASGRWQISNAGGQAPAWSRQGHELYYISADHQLIAVPYQAGASFTPGAAKSLFSTAAYASFVGRSYDVAPDGRFLFVKPPATSDPGARASIIVVTHWDTEVAARLH